MGWWGGGVVGWWGGGVVGGGIEGWDLLDDGWGC